MTKTVSTAEFLTIANRHGVRELGISISYRIDGQDRVRTFDYALMLPPQWPGDQPKGPRPAALEEIIGIDPSCWFDDGDRLPIDDLEFLSNCQRFTTSTEVKGTAIKQVRGYFELHKRLDASGFAKVIVGSGIQPILQWAQSTLQSIQDPDLKKGADQTLGQAQPEDKVGSPTSFGRDSQRVESTPFSESLPQDPWAAVLDWLLAHGYADETIAGDIDNEKAFALEALVGPSGKIGLSYAHVLGSKPTSEDVYAYWLRVARVSGIVELRMFSRDTCYHDRVTVTGSIAKALDALEREVEDANEKHTARRRRGEPAPKLPGEWMEFDMTPSENPLFVAPTMELRFALAFFYEKLDGRDLRQLSVDQRREFLSKVKVDLQEARRNQSSQRGGQHDEATQGCFVGGTLITTRTGPRAISSITVGDVVLGLGDAGLGWFRVRSYRMVRATPITVETTRGILQVTADHRLVGPNGANPACSLAPGTLLIASTTGLSLGYAVVLEVRRPPVPAEPCYNLYLDGAAVFVAGGICAHSFGRFPRFRTVIWRWVSRLSRRRALDFQEMLRD